jgi:hypothetical protein
MSYRQLARFAFCAVMVPAAASAQQVEFGPLVALYSPTGSYDHPANFFRVGTPDRPSDNRGVAWGGEARFWMNHGLGVQLQGATSSVDHPSVITPAGPSPGTSSHVTSATAQAMFGLLPASSRARLWVSAGGGMIHHSGTAYDHYGSPTHGVGVLGLGSAVALSHGLGANVGVTSLLYRWELSDNGALYQRGFEKDLLVHAGLTLSLH